MTEFFTEGGLKVERLPLHQGAYLGLGTSAFILAWNGFEVGQKQKIRGIFTLKERTDEPVSQFYRVTERRAALINAFLTGVIGQNDVKPQFVEKIGV